MSAVVALLDRYDRDIADSELDIISEFKMDLFRAYSHGGRKYHNVDHLAYVHDTLDYFESIGRMNTIDPRPVRWAAWYHDIIYRPVRGFNELLSAARAADELTQMGMEKRDVQAVVRLILNTENHVVPRADPASAVLMDADLGILAEDWPDYREYAWNIRKEFDVVPPKLYASGRIRVLESFLRKHRIFYVFGDVVEQRARKNIAREIELLRA